MASFLMPEAVARASRDDLSRSSRRRAELPIFLAEELVLERGGRRPPRICGLSAAGRPPGVGRGCDSHHTSGATRGQPDAGPPGQAGTTRFQRARTHAVRRR